MKKLMLLLFLALTATTTLKANDLVYDQYHYRGFVTDSDVVWTSIPVGSYFSFTLWLARDIPEDRPYLVCQDPDCQEPLYAYWRMKVAREDESFYQDVAIYTQVFDVFPDHVVLVGEFYSALFSLEASLLPGGTLQFGALYYGFEPDLQAFHATAHLIGTPDTGNTLAFLALGVTALLGLSRIIA